MPVLRKLKRRVAVLVMLSVAIGLFAQEQVMARDGPPMLAVLPFVSAGPGGDDESFASGMHDDFLTQLAQLQSIRVISRTSVLEYRDTVKNISEIGRELGADAILEGKVQSAGDQFRIYVQLIDTKTDEHLWAETYERELSPANIFDVQTKIAREIASAMQAPLTEQDVTQLSVIPTENMEAYRAYHRALEIRDAMSLEAEEYRQALEETVELDPSFTRAWAELVGHISLRAFGQDSPELTQRAEQILERIRTLAPESADYLIADTYYTYYILKNYDRALQIVEQAQQLRPSDAHLVELKSWIQRRQGDFDGRVETIRLARTLDPRNPRWTHSLIAALIVTHQYAEARVEIEDFTIRDDELSYWLSVLRLQEHRDLDRWADEVEALQKEFEGPANPTAMVEMLIAVRDYAGAEEILNTMQEQDNPNDNSIEYLSEKMIYQIFTYWFLRSDDRLSEVLAQARSILEKGRNSDGSFPNNELTIEMAIVTAAEGNTDETEQLVRQWRREAAKDLAGLANVQHYSCQLLGMAGSTAAAVECIRTGLVEPSFVMPFMEPYLPYYDSIRDEPAFVELLADIGDAASNP